MLPKGSFRPEDNGIAKFSVLEIFIAEARGRVLAVEFCQQRFRIEGVDLARAALHEQRDHPFGGGGQGRRFGGERITGVRSRRLMEQVQCGLPADAEAETPPSPGTAQVTWSTGIAH